jgi:hypothetical protein
MAEPSRVLDFAGEIVAQLGYYRLHPHGFRFAFDNFDFNALGT